MQRKPEPVSITSAQESLTADQSRRTKVYIIQMTIRVVCFIAALFVSGPMRWVLFSLAVVLPYIAVVKANLGRANNSNMENPMEYLQLEAEHNAARQRETPHLGDPAHDTFSKDQDATHEPPSAQHHGPTNDSQEPHNG